MHIIINLTIMLRNMIKLDNQENDIHVITFKSPKFISLTVQSTTADNNRTRNLFQQ